MPLSNKSLKNPDVQRQLAIAYIPGKPTPLADLTALMKSDHDKLHKVIATAGEPLR